ncbi:MAG: hypothetical protein ACJAYE_002583 [Candidatus Azotimanducaceae bacterium]
MLCSGAVNTQVIHSKRNQDVESAKEHNSSDEETAFEGFAGPLMAERGMAPADVADIVFEGISNDDFWILAHPEWNKVLTKRVAAMTDDNSLFTGFGASGR